MSGQKASMPDEISATHADPRHCPVQSLPSYLFRFDGNAALAFQSERISLGTAVVDAAYRLDDPGIKK